MQTAVLVIDLQAGLFEDEGKPFDFTDTIERTNILTRYARKNKLPVIFIQHEQAEGILKHGNPGWELVAELETDSNDLRVRKTTPNSFLKTNLQELLQQLNVNNLIICGYATEFCIDSTVRGAAALGYSIQLVSDAHTTHNKIHASAELIRKHHNETLSNIKSFGVPIVAVTTEEIINAA